MKKMEKCEICGNKELVPVLDLGEHPLCDDLIKIGSSEICKEYPIKILYCNHCYSAHQQYQVEKEILFSDSYHYRSRFTEDVLKGMQDFVRSCEGRMGSLNGKTIVDVGCNDGSLLNYFRDSGCSTIGVEPSSACFDAEKNGHEVYHQYFTTEIARQIREKHKHVDLITFTNVFAHIDDLPSLLKAVTALSDQGTVLVIENHYLGEIVEKHQFDTFYHEHPRTYTLRSFEVIAHSMGKKLLDVQFPQRYGGNIRVYIGDEKISTDEVSLDRIRMALAKENGFCNNLKSMQSFIDEWKRTKYAEICKYVEKYGKLRAKAFPGRAAILIKLLNLNTDHISAVYEKPGSMKIGNYVPGTRIEIHSDDELFGMEDQTAPILNLAWHIKPEIRNYLEKNGYQGEVIDIV